MILQHFIAGFINKIDTVKLDLKGIKNVEKNIDMGSV